MGGRNIDLPAEFAQPVSLRRERRDSFGYGRWWTVISAGWLHGGILHILFNMLWVRQLGPATAELYGAGRMIVIYTVAGICGFLLSSIAGFYLRFLPNFLQSTQLTVGASASIFGLLSASGHGRGLAAAWCIARRPLRRRPVRDGLHHERVTTRQPRVSRVFISRFDPPQARAIDHLSGTGMPGGGAPSSPCWHADG
jgi:hypothetical protein